MAMSKKERAEMEELRQRLSTIAALRWTEPVEPDVPVPDWKTGNELSKGFLPCGSDRVEVACSSSCYHAIGRNDKTNSQQARWLYSTRLLALRALRHRVELESAHKLARIDAQIENEKATQ